MSNPGDKPSKGTTDGAPPDSNVDDDKRSGRISYDERGNSVWEWQLETGVYSRDINTQRLKKLDLNDLSIAETATLPRLGGGPNKKPLPGGGFNPYDNSSSGRGNVGKSDPYNKAARPGSNPDPKAPAPRKPMDLKQLEQWIEIRKRVAQNKREEGDE